MIIKSAYVEITNRCNLDCRDCYNSSGRNRKTVELDPGVLMRFVEDLHVRYGVKAMSFSGGEPLLHTRIEEILKSMSEFTARYPDMDFNFITNGTMDNALFYELMERSPRFYLQISLDGPDEPTNASMRGPGNFARVIANCAGRRFCNKPVYKMILNKANARFAERYFHFVHEELGGLPAFAFVTPQGNAVRNWDEMQLPVRERSDIIESLRRLYKQYGISDVTPPLPTSHCDLTDGSARQNSFCIKPDGSVQPCQNLYDGRFTVGNLYCLDWEALSHNIDALSFSLSSRLSGDYGCAKCPIKGVCGRGCPAVSYILAGNLLAGDGDCELRKLSTLRMITTSK